MRKSQRKTEIETVKEQPKEQEEEKMTTTTTTTMMTPETWATTSRELVSQTRRWAETVRGMSMNAWQGVLAPTGLAESAKPMVEMVTTAHNQALDLWEASAKALIDQTVKLTERVEAGF